MCDPAHHSVIRATADSGKTEKLISPDENNCRDMEKKKKRKNMGNVTDRRFRDSSMGKKGFLRRREASVIHLHFTCAVLFSLNVPAW